jgi:hypothetical protein
MQLEREGKRDVKIKQSYKEITVWLLELYVSQLSMKVLHK